MKQRVTRCILTTLVLDENVDLSGKAGQTVLLKKTTH
jgi:hypothetical protein